MFGCSAVLTAVLRLQCGPRCCGQNVGPWHTA